MNRRLCVLLLCVFASQILGATTAWGHAMEPGLFDIWEQGEGHYRVHWRAPELNIQERGLRSLLPEDAKDPSFPNHCEVLSKKTNPLMSSRTYQMVCSPKTLHGKTIEIQAIESVPVETILRVRNDQKIWHTEVLKAGTTSFVLPDNPDQGAYATWLTYTELGLFHLLDGIDHLLFVFLLMLMVSSFRQLLIAITAFTVSHSLTLAMATLGLLSIPTAPTEALIALSIVFLAAEHLKGNRPSIKRIWAMAFSFGLLHGFGFAGALQEVGIPSDQAPLALLGFNLGVELGQIFFVSLLYLPLRAIRHHTQDIPSWANAIPGYGVGFAATYWTAQRLTSLF
jgi:hydrogenase/urease accessory protein HupE